MTPKKRRTLTRPVMLAGSMAAKPSGSADQVGAEALQQSFSESEQLNHPGVLMVSGKEDSVDLDC